MPRRCAYGCDPSDVPMHRFPNSSKFPDRFRSWVTLAGGKLESNSDYEYYENKRACDIHFTDKDKNRNKRLNIEAIPSLYLPGSTASPNVSGISALQHIATSQLAEESDATPKVTEQPAKQHLRDDATAQESEGADNTTLHLFPNPDIELDRFNTWKHAIGGHIASLDEHTVYKLRRVCHSHFEQRYHTRSNRLSANAVPTLHLSGFSITTRPPLHDITNRVVTENVGRPQPPDTEISIRPSTSAPLPPQHGHHAPCIIPVQPTTSTLVQSKTKGAKCFSPEITALGEQIKKLQKAKQSTMTRLKRALSLSENPTFQKTLKKFTTAAIIFTMLQLRESGKNKMGRRFKQEEKIMALALYKQGPRAYRWMRKFFVLPSPLTLSRMISTASLKSGINQNLFEQLKRRAKRMKKHEKLCVLLFDEVALKPHFDYNRRTDRISGFVNNGKSVKKEIADHALVFMLRGIHKNYKQPLAFSFCSKTTPKEELAIQIKEIVSRLYEAGFIVVATICDQGATNVSAVNYLINETRQKYLRMNEEFRYSIYEVDGNEIVLCMILPI